MKDILNTSQKDFLEKPALKKNPYVLPSGYLSTLEDSVHQRIHADKPYLNIILKVKPYACLVASFAIIFGICHGALTLFTDSPIPIVEDESFLALIDDGYIESSFIDYYYDEIEIDSSEEVEIFYIDEELSKEIEEYITEEDLLNYY